ncbi:hypothetical protein Acy02nite_90030 [Actinoplanes cyaneus]|uniref:Uncharacterized protein n=1 Tax=Actinoplanes cyaneus TaxID=52696 RepID=A0A919M9R0_9ACTN|nr:hypothetical protein Acy02nite_90030 [Actinoplanes cyaneus]
MQQVEAAGIAESLDLLEQMQDRDRGVLLTALAQMIAVGVDEGGPIARRPDQVVGFGDSGVALDGVQREVEPAGAFEQADAFVEQGVDVVPPFAGGGGLWPVGRLVLTVSRGSTRTA